MSDTPRVVEEILENIIQGVVMFDDQRRLIVWNKQYESILNYPENFLHVGLHHYDMALFFARRGDFGKGDAQQIARDRIEFLWSGQQQQAELTVGGNKTFELLYGKSGDNGLVATYTDITERKKMDTSLRESEARFKGYVEIAADWYWETDADSRFTYFSENVLGGDATVKTSDLIGIKRLDRIELAKMTPAEKELHFADFNARRPFRNFEYTVDDILHVSISGNPVFSEDGTFTGYRGVGRDITNRVNDHKEITERKLAEERQRVHTGAVQLMQQTTAATNEASSIEDALQACIDLICDYIQWPLGHAWLRVKSDNNRLEPTNIWHMDAPDKYALFRQETEITTFVSGKGLPGRVLASGKSEWIPDLGVGTLFMRAKIASQIGVTSGFALPLLVNQDVVGVLEFFTEEMTDVDESLMDLIPYLGTQIGRIVERIWAQEELLAAKEAAETANMAKTAFLSSISHELRTPLNSIIGFGELLSSDPENPLTEDQDNSITHITGSGKQLLDLIDVILELSNIESGDIELVLQEFPVMGLVDETLDQVADLAASRNIVISVNCQNVQAPVVVADYARLSQVMTTILLNAVTHNKENGEVTIKVSPADHDRLKISVTDTGDGIAETRQGKLFQPYANLETGQDAAGGTGFGLAIACGLMSLMNGTIGLHSEEGKGSTFWIDLPLARADDMV